MTAVSILLKMTANAQAHGMPATGPSTGKVSTTAIAGSTITMGVQATTKVALPGGDSGTKYPDNG